MTSITVRIASNYGTRVVYPVCDTARKLAELSGKTTLTPAALKLIKELGYTVNVAQETL